MAESHEKSTICLISTFHEYEKRILHKRSAYEYHFRIEAIANACVYAAILPKWRRNNSRSRRDLPTLSPADGRQDILKNSSAQNGWTSADVVKEGGWHVGCAGEMGTAIPLLDMRLYRECTFFFRTLLLWLRACSHSLVWVTWAFLVCLVSCLGLTYFTYVLIVVPLLPPFFLKIAAVLQEIAFGQSLRSGKCLFQSSLFRCNSVGDADNKGLF